MITNITVKETRSLGNYESRTVEISAVVGEDEDADAVAHSATAKASWYVVLPELESKYRKAKHDLEHGTDAEKAAAVQNIAKFEAKKQYVESL